MTDSASRTGWSTGTVGGCRTLIGAAAGTNRAAEMIGTVRVGGGAGTLGAGIGARAIDRGVGGGVICGSRTSADCPGSAAATVDELCDPSPESGCDVSTPAVAVLVPDVAGSGSSAGR